MQLLCGCGRRARGLGLCCHIAWGRPRALRTYRAGSEPRSLCLQSGANVALELRGLGRNSHEIRCRRSSEHCLDLDDVLCTRHRAEHFTCICSFPPHTLTRGLPLLESCCHEHILCFVLSACGAVGVQPAWVSDVRPPVSPPLCCWRQDPPWGALCTSAVPNRPSLCCGARKQRDDSATRW